MFYALVAPQGDIACFLDAPAVTGKGFRCLPVQDVRPEAGPDVILDGPEIVVQADKMVRTWTARPKTAAERLAEVHLARRGAYPSIGDQLDALFKARAGDPTALAAVDAAIAAVKAAHPKPVA